MSSASTTQSAFRSCIAVMAGCGLLIMLASCTASRQPAGTQRTSLPEGMKLVSAGPYSQCVPFARDHSGVQIYGDAWTWWSKAVGRYDRGAVPRHGAVLTLKKTKRLTAGHVAVVAAIVEPRKILVDHANWGDDAETRHKLHLRQPVIDVSPNNDWSAVRFLNTQGSYGAVYPAYGFIYSDTEIRTANN